MNTKSALMKITKSPQSNPIEQPPPRRICTSSLVPLLLLWMLPAGLGLMLAARATAQTFTTIYSFQGNGYGQAPSAGLVLSGTSLYGTATGVREGNLIGYWSGTVFALNTDGTGFTNLANGLLSCPLSGLVLSSNTLYGMGDDWAGDGLPSTSSFTMFALNTDGTGGTNLHTFVGGSVGGNPAAGLILSGNTLYGTAVYGGSSGNGSYLTVFALNTDGTGGTNLYSSTGGSDGYRPVAGLILSGNTLYGTAEYGGSSGNGTVFALNTNGTGFTTLHSFTACDSSTGTNSDGAFPLAPLILSGNTLYGTASGGGSSGNGTVFALNTDGTGFTTLHSFTAAPPYGTNSDGAFPLAPLILANNTLYGTASAGGTNGYGTVFSIFIQPQLTLIPSGPYVILAWPTNYSGFTLQSTTNLGSSAVWSTNSSPPVVIGGDNVVISTASGKQQFFRLSQ